MGDTVDLTIPADAAPGTYVTGVKFRREWGGEALNRGASVEVPVGPQATAFVPKTGNCATCHAGPSALGNVLHGVSDRRACFACHGPLGTEPDTPLDIRVHMVHSRSARFASVGATSRTVPSATSPRPRGNSGTAGWTGCRSRKRV